MSMTKMPEFLVYDAVNLHGFLVYDRYVEGGDGQIRLLVSKPDGFNWGFLVMSKDGKVIDGRV